MENTYTKSKTKKANYLLLSVALVNILGYGEASFAGLDLPGVADWNAKNATAFMESYGITGNSDKQSFYTKDYQKLQAVFSSAALKGILDDLTISGSAILNAAAFLASMDKFLKFDKDLIANLDWMLYGLSSPLEKRDLLFTYADRGVGYRIEDMMSIGLLDGLKANSTGVLNEYKKSAMAWVGDHGVANIPAKSIFDFTTIEKWSDRQSAITWYSNPNNAAKYDAANSVGLFLGMPAWCEIKKAAMWYGESGNATDAAKDIDDVTDSKTWASWDDKKQAIIKLKAVDDFIAGHSGLVSGGTSDGLTINKDALRRYLLTQNLSSISSLDNATLIVSTSVFLKDTNNGLTKVIPYELLNIWVECSNPVVRDGLLQWFSDSTQKAAYNSSFKNFLTGTYTAERILYALKMAYAVANGTNLAAGLSSNDDKRSFVTGLMNLNLDADAVFASKSLVDTSGASLSALTNRTAMAVAVYNNGRNLAGNLDSGVESSVVTQLVDKTITPAQITSVKDLIDASKRKGEDAAVRVQRMELALGVYNTSSNHLYSGLATGEDLYEIVNQLMFKFISMNDVTRANMSNAASLISTSISETALARSNRIATAIALYVNNLVGNSLDDGMAFVTQVMTTHNITIDEIKTLASIADTTSTSATTRAAALNTLRNNYNSLSAWSTNAASRTALLDAITMQDDGSSVIADKRTALAYFANNTALQAAFNSANSAGLFTNLTRWSEIKTVVDNYAAATAAGWGGSVAIMLGDISTESAANKRTALAYFTSDAAAVTNRAAFDIISGFVSDVAVWTDMKVVVDNAHALSTWGTSSASRTTLLAGITAVDGSITVAVQKRAALAYFANNSTRQASFDGAQGKTLFADLTKWADIQTVADNYAISTAAGWDASLGTLLTDISTESAVNRRTALAYFTSDAAAAANRAAFDIISGFVSDVTVWADMKAVVDNAHALSAWGASGASRTTLLAGITAVDGSTTVAVQKRAALAYFANNTARQAGFDGAQGKTLFADLTKWAQIQTVADNYAISTAAGWDASLGTLLTDISTESAVNRRTALAYFTSDAAAAANRAAFDIISGFVSDVTVWADMKAVVDNAHALSAWGASGASRTTLLAGITAVDGSATVAVQKRAALAYFANNSTRQASFDGAQGKTLFADLTKWADIQTVADNYAISTAASWSASLATLLTDISTESAANRRTALAYFTSNGAAVANRAAFDVVSGFVGDVAVWADMQAVVDNANALSAWGASRTTLLAGITAVDGSATVAVQKRAALAYFANNSTRQASFDGAQGKTLFADLTKWADIQTVADNYAISTAASWSASLTTLLTDISTESAANRRTALAYFTNNGAAVANRAAFDGADSKTLFSGLAAWSAVKTVVDNYGAAITLSWSTSLASLLTDISGETPTNRRTALAYFTSDAAAVANRAAFDVVSGFVTDVSTWSAMQTVVDNANALSAWGASAASRTTLLNDITAPDGSTTVAAQKRTALAYFADSTNGAARRAAFDNVSGAASGSFDIVDSAQIWSAIQYVIEHVDIHDALRTIVLTSHSFYDNLKGSADGDTVLAKSGNRSIIRALFDAGFTNGDIRNIAMSTTDTDAMAKNTSADQRALYIALRIVGAFEYLGTDSALQRQDLVAAVGQTVAQVKAAGDIASFAFHPSTDVAGRAAYFNSLIGLDSALKVSSSTALVDSYYRDGTASIDQMVMMDGLVAAGITSGDLGTVSALDKAAMALNASERERVGYIAARAVNGFASVASDSDVLRESIIQKVLLSKTAKDIYALKNLYTFSSGNGSSDESRATYIKGVISVNKALLDAGLYSGLVLTDANKKAIINDIVSYGKSSIDIENLSSTVINAAKTAASVGDGTSSDTSSFRYIIKHALGLI